jgi:polar amino acid transport system substrate-binding protein
MKRTLGTWLVVLVQFLATWLTPNAMASELKIAFAGDRPPFCFRKDNVDQGIEIDLLTRIMGDAGHNIKIVIIPKIRLIKAVKDKEVDAAATVQNSNDNPLYFSDVYLEFQNLVISKTNSDIELTHIDELKQYSFVIWQDGWRNLGSEFEDQYRPDSAGNFPKNYYQAYNQLSQNKMFWANRVQLIIVDRTIFEHHKKLLANEFNTNIPITYHDLFKLKTPYSVVFNDPTLRKQFNAGLRKLRANGDYQKIIDRYK